jgi:hypothetical protein
MHVINRILAAALVLITVSACEKASLPEQPGKLPGKWELRETVSGVGLRTYAEGNGTRYEFGSTTYEKYENGNLVKQGTYTVVQDDSAAMKIGIVIPAGQFTKRIRLDADNAGDRFFFQSNGSQLILLSGFFPLDGGLKATYEKQ